MDKQLLYLSKTLGRPTLREEAKQLDQRLKEGSFSDTQKAQAWEEFNATARMTLKAELYKKYADVRQLLRAQQPLYLTLATTIEDYMERNDEDLHTDLPKETADGIKGLLRDYKRLVKSINEGSDVQLEFKLEKLKHNIETIVDDNAAWQQLFDTVRAFIDKACTEMDSIEPKMREWCTAKVKGLP